MESRKDQLQKQIIEALKANDNNLYSLLKSQWAHRFGVESLEELKNLELTHVNQNPINEHNQKDDQAQDDLCEVDKEISIKNDDYKEKENPIETNKVVISVESENKESYEIVEKENNETKSINPYREYNSPPPKVDALIPLPPKPKYNYLNKWLLKS